MTELLFWLPDSLMVIGIVAIAFGLMIGQLSIRRAMSLLGLVVILLISGPFVDTLCDYLWRALPLWLLVPLILVLIFSLLRFLARLVLGERAAGEMIGVLAAYVVRWTFKVTCQVLAFPFRLWARSRKVNAVRG
jgi:hypothetical protein